MLIKFFGNIGERLGRNVDHEPAPRTSTVADLRRSLAAAYPDDAETLTGPRLKAVIDGSVVREDASVSGVDRIEFFPPVSGG